MKTQSRAAGQVFDDVVVDEQFEPRTDPDWVRLGGGEGEDG